MFILTLQQTSHELSFDTMFMYMDLVVVEIFNIYCWHVVLSRKPKNWPEIACKSHKNIFSA